MVVLSVRPGSGVRGAGQRGAVAIVERDGAPKAVIGGRVCFRFQFHRAARRPALRVGCLHHRRDGRGERRRVEERANRRIVRIRRSPVNRSRRSELESGPIVGLN